MTRMEVITSLERIRNLREHGVPDDQAFTPPEAWTDAGFVLDRNATYTVVPSARVVGRSMLGFRDTVVHVLQATGDQSRFQGNGESVTASPDHASAKLHNITVGDVGLAEHTLACGPGLGLVVDYRVDGLRFPLFDGGIAEMIRGIRPQLLTHGPSQWVTVRQPVAVASDTSFMIVEPDEGDHTLIVDHQFEHQNNALGAQRTRMTVTPERFAYIAAARTIAYRRIGVAVAKMLRAVGLDGIPGIDLTWKNHVVVDKKRILNANPAFEEGGRNYEPLMHEVVDKLALLGLLPGRFAGTLTTFRTSHADDVAAARILQDFLT